MRHRLSAIYSISISHNDVKLSIGFDRIPILFIWHNAYIHVWLTRNAELCLVG